MYCALWNHFGHFGPFPPVTFFLSLKYVVSETRKPRNLALSCFGVLAGETATSSIIKSECEYIAMQSLIEKCKTMSMTYQIVLRFLQRYDVLVPCLCALRKHLRILLYEAPQLQVAVLLHYISIALHLHHLSSAPSQHCSSSLVPRFKTVFYSLIIKRWNSRMEQESIA